MAKFSNIRIEFNTSREPVTIHRPSGFGVNEFGFFCVETDANLQMFPASDISSVIVNKSAILEA